MGNVIDLHRQMQDSTVKYWLRTELSFKEAAEIIKAAGGKFVDKYPISRSWLINGDILTAMKGQGHVIEKVNYVQFQQLNMGKRVSVTFNVLQDAPKSFFCFAENENPSYEECKALAASIEARFNEIRAGQLTKQAVYGAWKQLIAEGLMKL